MPPNSRRPEVGQFALDIRPQIVQDLEVRNSFAKATTPEYHGLWIENYADITKEQLDYVTPQMLHDSVIGVSRDAENSVYYRNPETEEHLWIAVSPEEHKQLGGNIQTLGNRVMSSVMAARAPRRDFTPDREAAVRGGVKAVTKQLDKLERYKANVLQLQVADVHWLQKSAETPGFAWKDGLSVRNAMYNVHGVVLKDMLAAARDAGGWDPEKLAGVEKVIDYRLFFDRSHNDHIKNWKTMLQLMDVYLGYKQALFSEKITKAKQYIDKHAESAE